MKFLRNLQFRFRGVRVYALVGKSGTGKSFRARLVAEKNGIDLMIDDGLLIRGQKILAGRSAKRENNYLTAVKTALFSDKDHRKEVLAALEREHFKRILVIGTSDKMVGRIVKTLNLPPPVKTINIEEIATADEIASAIQMRQTQGRHVIPVPSIEVKRNHSGFMTESLKVFLRRGVGLLRPQKIYEKSVVRPEFSRKGSVSISEAALGQMILHCVEEFGIQADVRKVQVRSDPGGYRLNLTLDVPFGEEMAGSVNALQTYIVESIERFTGVMIEEMNIVIDSISERQRRQHAARKHREERANREKRRDKHAESKNGSHTEHTGVNAKSEQGSTDFIRPGEDRTHSQTSTDRRGKRSSRSRKSAGRDAQSQATHESGADSLDAALVQKGGEPAPRKKHHNKSPDRQTDNLNTSESKQSTRKRGKSGHRADSQ